MNLEHLKINYFGQKNTEPAVYIANGNGAYQNTRIALSNIDLSSAQHKKVLLKPNAGRIAKFDKGITTHPQVVAAAIDAFQEAGATVVIGESPISGVNTMEAFDVTGISEVAKERNCKLLDMDKRKFHKINISEGVALKTIKVCPEIFEHDIIVSIPVMKTHMHTGVTLALKNMKGCLWRRSKVALHMLPLIEDVDEKPIDIAIADMSSVLRPHLSIIDGTICMEGLGPSAGSPKPTDTVLVSSDVYAADAVACMLMGIKPQNIPHLKIASGRGYGPINVSKIDIKPKNWKDFIIPFTLPPSNLTLEYPNINILDENSCSACQSSLYLFLKRYGKSMLDYCSAEEPLTFAIGKGFKKVPKGTLCIGNCTNAHKTSNKFISGCPPVSSEILRAITGKPSFDTMDGHGKLLDEDK
jgi:uncharacterized protein (DUF362 family)